MHPSSIARNGIMLTADLNRLGNEARQVQRATKNGDVHRIRRGAYIDQHGWDAADARGKQILRLKAVNATRKNPPVFSLASAAVLHGLPTFGQTATIAHVSSTSPGHSKNGVAQHLIRPGVSTVAIEGLTCTSLIDTLADLALTSDFVSTIVSLDHALHEVALAAMPRAEWPLASSPTAARAAADFVETLRRTLDVSAPSRGLQRSLRTIDFATHLSDSPGESVSRCHIHLLGFPPPELQHPFYDYQGRIGWGDFWWEYLRLLGEFDGEHKYSDPTFLAGRTPEQALADEKWREDRIRATNAGVSRWGWAIATDLRALYNKLSNAGLRPVAPRPKAL
jgi:hypothetical protein